VKTTTLRTVVRGRPQSRTARLVTQVIETVVFTYDDEDEALIVAETDAHLENNLRNRGRAFRSIPPGKPTPEVGDPF
jgi:hypothetical protein